MLTWLAAVSLADRISAVTALATAIGAIAVFSQLWKLSKQIRLQHFSDYTKRYQDIILRFPEDINESKFVLIGRSDYNQTMRTMRAYFDLSFEEWYLYRHKLIDSKTWSMWESGIKTALSKSAFKQAWDIIKEDTKYGGDFEVFVNNYVKSRDVASRATPS